MALLIPGHGDSPQRPEVAADLRRGTARFLLVGGTADAFVRTLLASCARRLWAITRSHNPPRGRPQPAARGEDRRNIRDNAALNRWEATISGILQRSCKAGPVACAAAGQDLVSAGTVQDYRCLKDHAANNWDLYTIS